MAADLLAEYGAETVWRVGLDALGFPPTWMTHSNEYATVRERLLQTDTDTDTER
jgi:hypothetical protein